MSRLLNLATATLFLGLQGASADHFRVYLLGGQSNAAGRGDASSLTAPLNAPQTDVPFYWHKTLTGVINGNLVQDTWVDLQEGSGHGKNSPAGHAVEFGPELSFGRHMADADPTVNIAIIKYAHGGSNLHTQWAEGGIYYNTFVATVQAGLSALTTAGHSYEMGGMVWVQGESDTGSPNDTNYEANLTDLIDRVRSDLGESGPGGDTLPFVISRLSDSQYTSMGSGVLNVRSAQETVATNGRQTAWVNNDGLTTYANGIIHFDADSQITIGETCAAKMLLLEADDTDRDGLLLSEEIAIGTDPNHPDSDHDGQEDGFEVSAGTNPLDPSSFFAITEISLLDGQPSLTWPSKPGNLYNVESSTGLTDWTAIAIGLPAADPGTTTTWVKETEGPGGSGVLAHFDFTGPPWSGNKENNFAIFSANTPSVDTDPGSTVSTLTNSGYTGGGYSSFYIRDGDIGTSIFSTSETPGVGMNLGGADSGTPTNHVSFTVTPVSGSIGYEALSFYTGTNGSNDTYDIELRVWDGSTEIVLGSISHTSGGTTNEPVVFKTIDFADFNSATTTEFRIYGYNVNSSSGGIRFDDIKLSGQSESDEPPRPFFRVSLEGQAP